MKTKHRPKSLHKVGNYVSFRYGLREVWAQIIEDRGCLGVGGGRIYRIRFDEDSGEEVAFEVAEADLKSAEPDPTQVLAYLKAGGLIEILRMNLGGGPVQTRAWLAYTRNGAIYCTSNPDRGAIGGGVVPFFALLEYRVYAPKADAVVEFLASFGLSRDQAEDVVRAVGTAPASST